MIQPNRNSSETRSNNLLAWLNTMPGIITAIATLLTAFAALYTSGALNQNSDKPSPDTFSKELSVSAKEGKTYVYPEDEQRATLEYQAYGKWTAIPDENKESKTPRGEIDADGHSDLAFSPNNDRPCPDSNLGALAIINQVGKCLYAGKTGSFDAEPGKTYKFVMSDVRRKYYDNFGEITVKLSKSDN